MMGYAMKPAIQQVGSAARHHYVPKLLLRPWLQLPRPNVEVLLGYFWDTRNEVVRCKARGLNSFCFQIDLLTLDSHSLGRDALESKFFRQIDDLGAIARDRLVEIGPDKLNADERSNFARLLLSLDIRRPAVVAKLRAQAEHLRSGLDTDEKIKAAMVEYGITGSPAEVLLQMSKVSFEDRALLVSQRLVNNQEVGGRLINAHWFLKTLGPYDGTFLLSDRPLIRFFNHASDGAVWLLPLSPKMAFIAAHSPENVRSLSKATPARFRKLLNVNSAAQCDRFLFSVNSADSLWMGKFLRRAAEQRDRGV